MEPSPQEVAGFKLLRDVAEWAGLDGDVDDATLPRGSLFDLLGVSGDHPVVRVARISQAAFDDLVKDWHIGTGEQKAPAKPAVRAAAIAFGVACRIAAGVQQPQAAAQSQAEGNVKAISRACDSIAALLPTLEAHAKNIAEEREAGSTKAVLKEVIDPRLEGTKPLLDSDRVLACTANYKLVYKVKPPTLEELTQEQLAALDSVLRSGRVPYADFAVWGPQGNRILKQVKLVGKTFNPDGTWSMVELFGPESFDSWDRSYGLLRSGLVQFGAVDLGILLNYRTNFHRRYQQRGPEVWHIAYQAECRCRLELMERLHRQVRDDYEDAKRRGRDHPYDPDRPWNLIWQMAADDADFWKYEFEDPALLVLAKTASLASMLGSDARAAGGLGQASPAGHGPAQEPAPKRGPPSSAGAPPPPPKKPRGNSQGELVHQVQNGKFVTNRSGVKLCQAFQTGQCEQTRRNNMCPKGTGEVHQCEHCLGTGHGSAHPRPCTKAPQPPKSSKGGSKGKAGARR